MNGFPQYHEIAQQSSETTEHILDLADPLDRMLNGYIDDISRDRLPTGTEQRDHVLGVQHGSLVSAKELIESHAGLIAAVGYRFKSRGIGSSELLATGSKELVRIALHYDTSKGLKCFNDDIVVALEHRFRSMLDGEPVPAYAYPPTASSPMDNVVHFVQGLEHVNPSKPLEPSSGSTRLMIEKMTGRLAALKQSKARENVAALKPAGRAVLPYLHLPVEEIAESQGLTPTAFGKVMEGVRDKLQVPSRLGAAIVAHEAGVQFHDLRPSPPIASLTIRQRQVASRVINGNREIAGTLGITQRQVMYALRTLYKITGARNRNELGLMAHVEKFEPSPEELAAIPEALKGFTHLQQKVLPRLPMRYKEIAEELDTSKDAINRIMLTSRASLGVSNNVEMALELRRRGVKFDIRVPKCDISTMLPDDDMKILESLDYFSDKAIGKATGIPPEHVSNIILSSFRKTGARTRVELALMLAEFDTGERRLRDTRTRRQVLADKLGVEGISDDDLTAYISRLTSKQQREAMTFYLAYDTDASEPPSWKDIGKRYGIRSASGKASLAVGRIREMIEEDKQLGS